MSSGADESGDDMVVGRTNESEERTILVATNGENAPDGYAEDFVFRVSIEGDHVLVTDSHGVDAINAKGSVSFPTGGMIGTIPPGNGVVGQGLNGIVGYVHAAMRNKNEEMDVGSGVLGIGGAGAIGVFGRGVNGVIELEQSTPRDPSFEANEMAGVLGRGQTGVSGDGVNGPGIHGRGLPGVFGESPGGPGVSAQGVTGVYAEGMGGAGVHGISSTDQGGIFSSKLTAQVWLVPMGGWNRWSC